MLVLVKNYLELQSLDLQLREIDARLETIPGQLAAADQKITEREAGMNRVREKIKQNEKEYRAIEGELEDLDGKRQKEQAKIYTVKTQQALDAVNAEIAALERKRTALEENGVSLLDDNTELKESLTSAAADSEALQREAVAVKQKLQDEQRGWQDQQRALQARRDECAARLTPQDIKLYMYISGHRDGIVVAELDLKTETCGGCQVHVRPQVVENVYAATDLVRCEGCSRILYLPEGETGEASDPA